MADVEYEAFLDPDPLSPLSPPLNRGAATEGSTGGLEGPGAAGRLEWAVGEVLFPLASNCGFCDPVEGSPAAFTESGSGCSSAAEVVAPSCSASEGDGLEAFFAVLDGFGLTLEVYCRDVTQGTGLLNASRAVGIPCLYRACTALLAAKTMLCGGVMD
jgi:hypothetical protein